MSLNDAGRINLCFPSIFTRLTDTVRRDLL